MQHKFLIFIAVLFTLEAVAIDSVDWGVCYPELQTHCNEKTDDESKKACLKTIPATEVSEQCMKKSKSLDPQPRKKIRRRRKKPKKPVTSFQRPAATRISLFTPVAPTARIYKLTISI